MGSMPLGRPVAVRRARSCEVALAAQLYDDAMVPGRPIRVPRLMVFSERPLLAGEGRPAGGCGTHRPTKGYSPLRRLAPYSPGPPDMLANRGDAAQHFGIFPDFPHTSLRMAASEIAGLGL